MFEFEEIDWDRVAKNYEALAFERYGIKEEGLLNRTAVFFLPCNGPEETGKHYALDCNEKYEVVTVTIAPQNRARALEINKKAVQFVIHEPLTNKALERFAEWMVLDWSRENGSKNEPERAASINKLFSPVNYSQRHTP